MKRQLIAEQWHTFAAAVLPSNSGPAQRREMRRAFYAGATALLYGLMENFTPDAEPTAADESVLEGVNEELETFARRVAAGLD